MKAAKKKITKKKYKPVSRKRDSLVYIDKAASWNIDSFEIPEIKIIKIHPTYMPIGWHYHAFLVDTIRYEKNRNGWRNEEISYYVITPGFIPASKGRKEQFKLTFEKLSSIIHEIEDSSWDKFGLKYKNRNYYVPLLTDSDSFFRKAGQQILTFFDTEPK